MDMNWPELIKDPKWRLELTPYLSQNYEQIIKILKNSSEQYGNLEIIPDRKDIFNAFQLSPEDTYVVLLGLDPYPTIINQKKVANGLSFSYIQTEKKPYEPPSLKNIFKEIRDSVYDNGDVHDYFYDTDLTRWSKQGVMLLNTALTTLEGMSGVHILHWTKFTKEVFKILNKQHPIVFILLGKVAQTYESYIDPTKHFILKAGHPSPLNTKGGFFGSGVFKECNRILKDQYNIQIKW